MNYCFVAVLTASSVPACEQKINKDKNFAFIQLLFINIHNYMRYMLTGGNWTNFTSPVSKK